MAKTIKKYWLVILFLLISFSVRFYNISSVPYALDGDETAFGYYGFSLLKNLSDEYGNKLPLYFSSIGDYKYPVYAYLTTIPVALFGLNEFSTRFTSAFFGSLFPLIVFMLAKYIYKDVKAAYLSMIIATLTPMGIMFSRGAYEANIGLFFSSLGILLVGSHPYLSVVSFIVSIFSYSANRIYILLFLIIYSFVIRSKKVFIVFCLLLVVVGLSFLDKKSLVRANDIGFNQRGYLLHDVERGIWEDGLVLNGNNLLITRLFNNKPIVFLKSLGERYFQHLNPTYLFFASNPNMPKYSIPGIGLFYYFEIITMFVGLYYLSKLKTKDKLVPLIIIATSIIPPSLTIETPNPIRMLSGLTGWLLLSGYGAYKIIELVKINRKLVYIVFGFVFLLHFMYFIHQYFINDVIHDPWYTDGGVKEMVISVEELKSKYSKIVLNGDPYIFFLFYNKVDPRHFLNYSKIGQEQLNTWNRVDSYENIVFNMPFACPKVGKQNVLYVCKRGDIPINSKLIKTIKFKDGNIAFNLIEFIPMSESIKQVLPENVHYMAESDSKYNEGLIPESSDKLW